MRRFRPLLAEHDLTEQQWRVLRVLHDSGRPMSVGEIAEATCLLGPSLSRMLGTLADRDVVTRRGHSADARRAEVGLSDAGRRLVDRIAPSSERVYRGLEAELGADELLALERALARVAAL